MFDLLRSPKPATIMLLVVLLLAACGGDDTPTPTSEPTTAPTEAPAAPESPLQPESPLSTSNADTSTGSQSFTVSAYPYTMTPPAIPTSQAGMGTLSGRLISTKTGLPLNKQLVRMGEVECPGDVDQAKKREQCIWTISNAFSPSTFTDENGFFVFTDVPPQDYVTSIGDMMVYNGHKRVADENGPFIWTVPADEIVDIGEHHVEW